MSPKAKRPGRGFRRQLRYLLLAPLLCLLAVNVLPEPRLPADPMRRIERLLRAGLRDEAEAVLEPWARDHPDSLELQYRLIVIHFQRPGPRRHLESPADEKLREMYERTRDQSTGHRRDVATYALGLYWAHLDAFDNAIEHYSRVQEEDLPYLNNSWGFALFQLGRPKAAIGRFRREIALRHNIRGAVYNLAKLYLAHRDWSRLESLQADRETASHVPDAARRALLLHQHRAASYLREFLGTYRMPLDWRYAIIALYGSSIWFLLVRWWDVFEKEPVRTSILAVLAGALVSNGAYLVHDVLSQWAHVDLESRGLRDFVHWFALVGLVEELLKFAPVLLVYTLAPREIDEPVDWMVYACLSALGFSVLENYQYLLRYGLHVGVGRIFMATPVHLSLSGVLALSIPEARHRGWNVVLTFLAALGCVAAVHGFYDFLAEWSEGRFRLLMYIVAFAWGAVFIRLLGGVQTLSPFRQRIRSMQFECTSWFYTAYLALCTITFLFNAATVSHKQATRLFFEDLLLIVLFLNLLQTLTRFSVGRAALRRKVRAA